MAYTVTGNPVAENMGGLSLPARDATEALEKAARLRQQGFKNVAIRDENGAIVDETSSQGK